MDLSLNGLQIKGELELYASPVYKLRIEMPKEVMDSRILIVDAKCIWCKKSVDPNFYISGFKLENIEEKTKEKIKVYIRSSVFRSPEFYKYPLKDTVG